jgi:hypothetical protein
MQKEIRLALTCEEFLLVYGYCRGGSWVENQIKFRKLFAFLAELAQAPIYRNGPQIDVIEPTEPPANG